VMGGVQYRHYGSLAHKDRNVSMAETETCDILRYSTKCKGSSWQLGIVAQEPKTSVRPSLFTIYPKNHI